LPALVAGLLVALLLAASVARSETVAAEGELAGHGLTGGGQLLLESTAGDYMPAVTQASKAHFEISGMIAVVRLEQAFQNASNEWVEGVYSFPLPVQAAVRYMEIAIGERRIIGTVREKSEASAIYQAARKAGKKASLVQQQRANMFSNRIANIGPGETVAVTLEYVQPVEYVDGRFSIRLPTTITPRYMPGAPLLAESPEGPAMSLDHAMGWAFPTSSVPDARAISPYLNPRLGSDSAPLNPIEITAELDPGIPLASVDSAYHEISLERSGQAYRVELAGGKAEMDRDFVLNWRPVSGRAPTAALFTEQVDGDYFGLLMVVPPAAATSGAELAREIVIVVDTSGSMGGVSISQARESVAAALRQLQPSDAFNVIEFNSDYRALFRVPVQASPRHVQDALDFVRGLEADGGTEMLPALRAALATRGDADQYRERPALRQVIFITDGAVGNEAQLFEEISARLGESRLFTVGIGSAPNSWFMRKAAEYGRGTHTHIGDNGEVAEVMSSLFSYLSQPVAADVEVAWNAPVEVWPRRIPDLYRGHPLLLAVKFGANPPSGAIMVSADIAGQPWSQSLQSSGPNGEEEGGQHPGVASLWARKKIAGLLDLKVEGESEESVRSRVLPLALQHQLLSPYTSFVAVEERVSRPEGERNSSKPVANSRPRGQTPQTYAYPQTATTGPAQLWLGLLLMFAALIVRVMRREEVDHVPAQ
jgi:Ca-activated chloride channel family protein